MIASLKPVKYYMVSFLKFYLKIAGLEKNCQVRHNIADAAFGRQQINVLEKILVGQRY